MGARLKLSTAERLGQGPMLLFLTLKTSCLFDRASNFVYKRSSMPATFFGSNSDEMFVKPTMSEKNIVTQAELSIEKISKV